MSENYLENERANMRAVSPPQGSASAGSEIHVSHTATTTTTTNKSSSSSSSQISASDWWNWVVFLASLPVPHIKKALNEAISDAWRAHAASQLPFANEEWFESSMRVPRSLYPVSRVGGGYHHAPAHVTHYLEDEYFTVFCGPYQRVVWTQESIWRRYTHPSDIYDYSWLHNVLKQLTTDMCFPFYPSDENVARLDLPEIFRELHASWQFAEPWFNPCCANWCSWDEPHNFAHPDFDVFKTGCHEDDEDDLDAHHWAVEMINLMR